VGEGLVVVVVGTMGTGGGAVGDSIMDGDVVGAEDDAVVGVSEDTMIAGAVPSSPPSSESYDDIGAGVGIFDDGSRVATDDACELIAGA